MSRSRRKIPIAGIAGESNAPYKKKYHRKERRKGKEKLHRVLTEGLLFDSDPAVDLEHPQEKYDWWDSEKDGKKYHHNALEWAYRK